jgi:hypothetical protein
MFLFGLLLLSFLRLQLQTTLPLLVPLLLLLVRYVPGIYAVAVVPNVTNTLAVACAPTAVAYS